MWGKLLCDFFAVDETVEPIDCTSDCVSGDYSHFIITRLWILKETATLNTQGVSDKFESGFAQTVAELKGFQQYLGAPLFNSSLVFFFNIFANQIQSQLAQKEAKDFREAVLANDIDAVSLVDGQYDFLFRDCKRSSMKKSFIATRRWELLPNATFVAKSVTAEFQRGFAPSITKDAGFQAYGGVQLSDGTIFFYNVFSTRSGAITANEKAAQFFEEGVLFPQIQKVNFEEGTIDFDFHCVEPSTINPPSLIILGCLSFFLAAVIFIGWLKRDREPSLHGNLFTIGGVFPVCSLHIVFLRSRFQLILCDT